MKVLFLGHLGGNSKYHYKNLKKKTKKIDYLDLDSFFRKNRVLGYLFNNITPLIFSPIIYLYFQLKITGYYDLIYVTSGEYLSRKTVKFLRKKCKKIPCLQLVHVHRRRHYGNPNDWLDNCLFRSGSNSTSTGLTQRETRSLHPSKRAHPLDLFLARQNRGGQGVSSQH